MTNISTIIAILLLLKIQLTQSSELTFELPDNANQCFYEDIKEAGVDSTLEFQVC